MDLLLFRPQPRGAPRWWHPLGTVWVLLHLGGSQIFLYYILRPVLKIVSPRTRTKSYADATRWLCARPHPNACRLVKLEVQNIRPPTFSPPCIVISNHQSAVDVMLVVACPATVRQTAKKRVFDAPFLGIGCKMLGHVMVEPNEPRNHPATLPRKTRQGASVHFYPEGTRSHDGFVQRFHRGAFELAVELNQEILPVILCDTNTACRATPGGSNRITPSCAPCPASRRRILITRSAARPDATLRKNRPRRLQKQLDELNTPRVRASQSGAALPLSGPFTLEQFVFWKLKLDPMFPGLTASCRAADILDLGCGYGLATHWLAQFTDTRTFLTWIMTRIRSAPPNAPRMENPRIQFEFQRHPRFEYPQSDTILLLDVLHYWTPEKAAANILEKARRALASGWKIGFARRCQGRNRWRTVTFIAGKFLRPRFGLEPTREGLHF
jgi:1-acyl-sn-glycerol-3-phosphate acyltransferase